MSPLFFDSDFSSSADELQPREKLHRYGPQSLQLWELVALLFRTGERRGGVSEDVAQLSKRMLGEAGFKGLFQQGDVETVQHNLGLYKSHAETLVAVAEVARRLHGSFENFDASLPQHVVERFENLKRSKQEQCFVLHLNKAGQCTFQELIAMGQSDAVTVHPSDVLRSALWLGVKRIALVHNHPKAPAKPSQADIRWTLHFTKRVWELHQIELTDHVIIGPDDHFSFKEAGLI